MMAPTTARIPIMANTIGHVGNNRAWADPGSHHSINPLSTRLGRCEPQNYEAFLRVRTSNRVSMSTSTHSARSYPFEGGCTEEMVSAELRKMLQSQVFGRSRRLRRFLRFSVEQTLLQQTENLKEYSIGLEVFEKPESFDPRMDSIVRVVARRLRMMVDRYYETDGAADETLIVFHSASYVPHFRLRSARSDCPPSPDVPQHSPLFLSALPMW